jgi:hypothetical protein
MAVTRSNARDQLIMAQALYEASFVLRNREPAYLREPSNANDMELMLWTLFPSMAMIYRSQDLRRRAHMLGFRPDVSQPPPSDDDMIEFILANEPTATFMMPPKSKD